MHGMSDRVKMELLVLIAPAVPDAAALALSVSRHAEECQAGSSNFTACINASNKYSSSSAALATAGPYGID